MPQSELFRQIEPVPVHRVRACSPIQSNLLTFTYLFNFFKFDQSLSNVNHESRGKLFFFSFFTPCAVLWCNFYLILQFYYNKIFKIIAFFRKAAVKLTKNKKK